jgi:hypothetical protein
MMESAKIKCDDCTSQTQEEANSYENCTFRMRIIITYHSAVTETQHHLLVRVPYSRPCLKEQRDCRIQKANAALPSFFDTYPGSSDGRHAMHTWWLARVC